MPYLALFCCSAVLLQGPPASRDARGEVAGYVVPKERAEQVSKFKGQAPAIEGADSLGKPISLSEFAGKPVILVFVERDCPYSRMAKAYYDQLQFAYKKDATVLGIIDANQDDAGEWVEAATPRFRLILDPDLKVATAYGATHGLHTVLLGPEHNVVKAWAGFSASMFKELSALLSKQKGVHSKAPLKFGAAPTQLTCGNPLKPMEKKG